MIAACYHPLPLSACMLHFDLVSILFNPYILQHFSENVFTLVSLVLVCVATHINLLTFVQSSTSLAYL